MADVYDMHVHQGADIAYVLTVTDAAGSVVSNTGATVTLTARTHRRATTTLLSVDSSGANIALGGADGVITLAVPGATTAAINQSGVYDLEITYSGGAIERLLTGRFVLHPEATR